MKISILKSNDENELRVPITVLSVKRLVNLDNTVLVESGVGKQLFSDQDYIDAGATIAKTIKTAVKDVDLIIRLNAPNLKDIEAYPDSCIHISLLDPFRNVDIVKAMQVKKISVISLEMIPRTTLAQKMDVLSSQASLAGYSAVIKAADKLDKVFPMMMTPAGTISPATVFVIGAGVAGLQAIATAKRLGARVEAFDTRPIVAEQVQSLGAKFVQVDLGDTGQTKGGYANALTDEQLAKQKEVMAKHCAKADVVITTAQLFGRPAPQVVSEEMVKNMRPGSVIVDLATSTGGNVAGSVPDKTVESNGVYIIGDTQLSRAVSRDASNMFSENVCHFIDHALNKETQSIQFNFEDEIIAGAVICHEGAIVNSMLATHIKGEK